MHTSPRPTPSKCSRTATCALSLILLFATTSSSAGEPSSTAACGLGIAAPDGISLRLDDEAPPPLCVLRGEGGPPMPFINSVTVLRWSRLPELQVDGQPLRTIGFFRLGKYGVTYGGRPSYEDGRSAFAQRVIGKPTQLRSTLAAVPQRLTVRTQLRVKWLRAEGVGVDKEVEDTIVCTDTATWDRSRVVIFNGCAPKGDPAVDRIAAMSHSLTLLPEPAPPN